ncbi:bifunctional 2-polyprenyl-6-hydroxyphenol methylase/3-demethylubiquinol 3-O-methyltransferase UbiG [Dichotomicrobium thermohalophilum]|uniref:Ubiquinone biosynthesis O-methyltransferase n=1 Tax=Dichotomicrobium thermohalophilum TaxID=933063 RepID=A0A397QB84_9HYPH|nr:bifunctional 2-polyprenyl-6-hydroxyphenol methylase/3-demethylubiquinol 3-O-methyltransferase UbiG [Dichotomicrobium thermohalophilum]RIA55481.1 3-demethylubiquinone-9 3-methyltransferase [Dichotomicrobium thermohalophilum]
MSQSDSTLDEREVERFRALAAKWWDPEGEFAPLHAIGPERLRFLREQLVLHFARDRNAPEPLEGLRIADIGCGGGLVSEPLARLGASITGIDPAEENVAAARAHAADSGLEIDYRAARVEDLAAEGAQFDAVIALEVVEHVPDVPAFINVCTSILRPGGLMLLSTINRTARAFALAIVGAEYVLRWLPRGTHQWDRFVTPDELAEALRASGLRVVETRGLTFNPLTREWRLSDDTGVNYFMSAARPASD